MIINKPETNQTIIFDNHCGDIQFDLSGDEAIANEDINDTLSRQKFMYGGLGNNLTSRGNNKGIFRTRVKSIYLEL